MTVCASTPLHDGKWLARLRCGDRKTRLSMQASYGCSTLRKNTYAGMDTVPEDQDDSTVPCLRQTTPTLVPGSRPWRLGPRASTRSPDASTSEYR